MLSLSALDLALAINEGELIEEILLTLLAAPQLAWFFEKHPRLKGFSSGAASAIFADRPTPLATTVEFQLAALRQAGFTETGTLWQFLDDYIVAGWK